MYAKVLSSTLIQSYKATICIILSINLYLSHRNSGVIIFISVHHCCLTIVVKAILLQTSVCWSLIIVFIIITIFLSIVKVGLVIICFLFMNK